MQFAASDNAKIFLPAVIPACITTLLQAVSHNNNPLG